MPRATPLTQTSPQGLMSSRTVTGVAMGRGLFLLRLRRHRRLGLEGAVVQGTGRADQGFR